MIDIKTLAITLFLLSLALSSCGVSAKRNYSNETADSLRASYIEEKQQYAELHRTGKVSKACLDAIHDQLDMALESLDHDAKGETQQRDRTLQLAEEAAQERERLGCNAL